MTSTDLATLGSAPPALARTHIPTALAEKLELARFLATARAAIPEHYHDHPGDILAIMLAAEARGVELFDALQNCHVIDGKVGYSAGMLRGFVRRAGHKIHTPYEGPDKATVRIIRADEPTHPYEATFTWDEAETAGLATKKNWRLYRTDMLWNRAFTRVFRRACDELVFGPAYTPEELGAEVTDEEGNVVLVEPGRRAVKITAEQLRHPGDPWAEARAKPAADQSKPFFPYQPEPEDLTTVDAVYAVALAGIAETAKSEPATALQELRDLYSDAVRAGEIAWHLTSGATVREAIDAALDAVRSAGADAVTDGATDGEDDPADAEVIAEVVAEAVGETAPPAPTNGPAAAAVPAHLCTQVDVTGTPVPDPPELCRNSPARRGYLRALAARGDVDTVVLGAYGLPPEQVSSLRLRALLTGILAREAGQ